MSDSFPEAVHHAFEVVVGLKHEVLINDLIKLLAGRDHHGFLLDTSGIVMVLVIPWDRQYHNGMNVSCQVDPRANQKERTRAAIVDGGLKLLREGTTPTVASAAVAAKVSRTTAYRYFPTQDSLLVEVLSVTPSTAIVEKALERNRSGDAKQRLLALLDLFNPILLREEGQYRAALRVYLDTWLTSGNTDRRSGPRVRAGRRMRWLDEVLAPLRGELPEAAWRRLRNALSLTLGIDSVVIMKDVCGIEQDEEILDVLRWTALAVLNATLTEEES